MIPGSPFSSVLWKYAFYQAYCKKKQSLILVMGTSKWKFIPSTTQMLGAWRELQAKDRGS